MLAWLPIVGMNKTNRILQLGNMERLVLSVMIVEH